MDRLTIFDDCALVGQSHRRAVDLIVESAESVAASEGGPRLEIVVGEPGGGRTRVLREVFERLCERLDPDGAYADTLASQSLQADRLDSAAPAPFWWWHLDFGREESLFRLVGADLEQLKVARSDRAALISFLNGLATVSGLLGATLPLNFATLFDIRDVEEALQATVGAQEQQFEHSITATVGHLAASIALLSRRQLFVLVIDDVERADEKAPPLIETLLRIDGAKVLMIAAGDAAQLATQASTLARHSTVASVARRHSTARAHPLEPLRGGDLETLAGSAGRTESGAQLMAMTAGLPARLAAFVERPEATDPFAPPDARRNRFWAELERGWPLVEAYPASVALADDIATCAGDAVSLAELRSRHRTPAATAIDPMLEAGVCVVTDDKTLAWRSPADFQFFVRYRALDPEARPAGTRRSGSIDDLRLPATSTVTARTKTTALRAAIIDGRSTISDVTARWHAGLAHVAALSPAGTPDTLRMAVAEATLASHLHPESADREAQGLWLQARIALSRNEWVHATELLAAAAEVYRRTGPPPEWLLIDLGNAADDAGQIHAAVEAWTEVTTHREQRLGSDHPNTLTTRNNLANAHQTAGDLTRAITLHEQNLNDSTRILGPDHPTTLTTRNNLATAHQTAGDLTRAIALFEQNLAVAERALSPGHPMIETIRANLERARSEEN